MSNFDDQCFCLYLSPFSPTMWAAVGIYAPKQNLVHANSKTNEPEYVQSTSQCYRHFFFFGHGDAFRCSRNIFIFYFLHKIDESTAVFCNLKNFLPIFSNTC